MKHLTVLVLAGFIFITCHSQQPINSRGEFATNSNGLMYSDADMGHLRFIVDSLNLKFKNCDLNKTYFSLPQSRVYYVSFKSPSNDLKAILDDLKNMVSFEELVTKHRSLIRTLDTNQIIIQTESNKESEGEYYFLEGKPGDGYERIYFDKKFDPKKDMTGKWHFDYSEKDKKSKDGYYYLACRFFPERMQLKKIPDNYGRLIQYVDCMIDTSSYIFLTDNYAGGWFREKDVDKVYHNLKELSNFINAQMKAGNLKTKTNELSKEQFEFADSNLSSNEIYRSILSKTVADYVAHKSFSFQLEHLAEKAGLYDKALLMKRSYRVMGNCSQDESPRLHARDIAMLAGKSHSWDIFLRAHLDIMNDRFERASDGSYAWGNRKTYLKELEELNLNIVDLMLGLTFRASNAAPNHYYGTVWRLGWALTESKEKSLFESKAINIMKDDGLDEFNKGLVFLLYKSYLDHLEENEAETKIKELKKIKDSFHSSIKNSIDEIELPKQRKRGR
jgi:hypothetical protein